MCLLKIAILLRGIISLLTTDIGSRSETRIRRDIEITISATATNPLVADQDQESTQGLSETMINNSLIEITNSATANNTLVADQYQGSTQGLSETINNGQMEITNSATARSKQ